MYYSWILLKAYWTSSWQNVTLKTMKNLIDRNRHRCNQVGNILFLFVNELPPLIGDFKQIRHVISWDEKADLKISLNKTIPFKQLEHTRFVTGQEEMDLITVMINMETRQDPRATFACLFTHTKKQVLQRTPALLFLDCKVLVFEHYWSLATPPRLTLLIW